MTTWWRRIQRLGTTAFGDLCTWNAAQQEEAFSCLIDCSWYPELVAHTANKKLLFSPDYEVRLDHLDDFVRSVGESRPLEELTHHLTLHPNDPAYDAPPTRRKQGYSRITEKPQPRALNTSAGGGQPRRPQWRPSTRPRREKGPEPAAQVLWVKKDGLCSTCNCPANTPGHVQPCTLPRFCWNCDKQGHEAESCPQPRPKERKPKRGKPARVNHVTPARTPSAPAAPAASVTVLPVMPAVNAVSAAHKGSAVWSVHSTTSEAALKAASLFVVWDFNAPIGSKLQSVLGIAGVYDTGQLTSSAVVMCKIFFEQHFGLD